MSEKIGEEEILRGLSKAVIEGDVEVTKKLSKTAIERKIPPLKAINEGLSKGIDVISDRFRRGEIYLPELILAADAINGGLETLLPALPKGEETRKGKIVLGTVKGDIHEIGKNIVAVLLTAKGFEVFDLGTDVEPKEFMEKAEELKTDIIGMSSLMTTTMVYQRDLIKLTEDAGLRNKYYIVVGGGVIEPSWVRKIKADGYGKMAYQAVELCKLLMGEKPQKPLKEPVIME